MRATCCCSSRNCSPVGAGTVLGLLASTDPLGALRFLLVVLVAGGGGKCPAPHGQIRHRNWIDVVDTFEPDGELAASIANVTVCGRSNAFAGSTELFPEVFHRQAGPDPDGPRPRTG